MSLSTFNYTITALTTEICSGILQSGDISSVSWQINGDSAFDRCYVAIRPLNDLLTDGAILSGQSVACGQGSASFTIPDRAENATIKLQGQPFVYVINAPNSYHTNSCAFKVFREYSPPWNRTDVLALVGTIFGAIGVLLAIGAFWAERLTKKRNKLK